MESRSFWFQELESISRTSFVKVSMAILETVKVINRDKRRPFFYTEAHVQDVWHFKIWKRWADHTRFAVDMIYIKSDSMMHEISERYVAWLFFLMFQDSLLILRLQRVHRHCDEKEKKISEKIIVMIKNAFTFEGRLFNILHSRDTVLFSHHRRDNNTSFPNPMIQCHLFFKNEVDYFVWQSDKWASYLKHLQVMDTLVLQTPLPLSLNSSASFSSLTDYLTSLRYHNQIFWNHHDNCSFENLLTPIIFSVFSTTWFQAVIYCLILLYLFLGIAIISDIFMCSIEVITSQTRVIRVHSTLGLEVEEKRVKIWNDSVANLTLMALGSSAPEILLSIIEIVGNGFQAGELGAATIVGSAAFNLLIISAVCVTALPDNQVKKIREFNVFLITSFFSVFAYIWLFLILVIITPDVIELWEAILTFIFFPLLVFLAYLADRNFFRDRDLLGRDLIITSTTNILESASSKASVDDLSSNRGTTLGQGFYGSILKMTSSHGSASACRFFPEGKLSKKSLMKFVQEVRRIDPDISDEDVICLAASLLFEEETHSRLYYRISAVRSLSGARDPIPRLNHHLQQVRDLLKTQDKKVKRALAKHAEETLPAVGHPESNRLSARSIPRCLSPQSKVPQQVSPGPHNLPVFTFDSPEAATADKPISDHPSPSEELSTKYKQGNSKSTHRKKETKKHEFHFSNRDSLKITKPIESILLKNRSSSSPQIPSMRIQSFRSERSGSSTKMSSTREGCPINSSVKSEAIAVVSFSQSSVSVLENEGIVWIDIIREGRMDNEFDVIIETIDQTALSAIDYMPVNERIRFYSSESVKRIPITIVDNEVWNLDKVFLVKLSLPRDVRDRSDVAKGPVSLMSVVIVDDDEPGCVSFAQKLVTVDPNVCSEAVITVLRSNGLSGELTVQYKIIDATAVNGRDYHHDSSRITFQSGCSDERIVIRLTPQNCLKSGSFDDDSSSKSSSRYKESKYFQIELQKPLEEGSSLGSIKKILVVITSDPLNDVDATRLLGRLKSSKKSLKLHAQKWIHQFQSAVAVKAAHDDILERQEDPTLLDYVLHVVSFQWKIFFAFIPPVSLLGGWLTFLTSLILIGIVTAIVGDVASTFGCLIGLEKSVNAITFVALGTSLPDLFASRTAVRMESSADNAIGNVTGSNSVNVFLGLGLPWLMAAVHWSSQDKQFVVPAGNLGFVVGLYTAIAVIALLFLVGRRFLLGGEVGGSRINASLTALLLAILWFIYVILSALQSYGILVI